MFCYSLRRAVPDCPITIYVRGDPNQEVVNACQCDFVVGYAPKYPSHLSTTNALRFVDDPSGRYDYWYLTDADFVFLPHDPPFPDYYVAKAKKWSDGVYWGARGPKRGSLKRIRGGCFLAGREWYEKTAELREKYAKELKLGKLGKTREDDETMLWEICAGSGLACPTKRGNKRKAKYKEIHLGDFKFEHRWTDHRKMSANISDSNMLKWFRLQEDDKWLEIRKICEQDGHIAQIMKNVDTYMEERRKIYREKCRVRDSVLQAKSDS